MAAAEKMVRVAWERFHKAGRWVQSDRPLVPMLEGRIAIEGSSLPSASAVITAISMELPSLARDPAVQKKLSSHLDQVAGQLLDSVFWYAGYVELLEPAQPLR